MGVKGTYSKRLPLLRQYRLDQPEPLAGVVDQDVHGERGDPVIFAGDGAGVTLRPAHHINRLFPGAMERREG